MKLPDKFIKIYKTATLFFILLFLCADCSITNDLHHDKYNPCGKGEYHDATECDYWKKNFPREYEHYLKRMQKKSAEKK